MRLEVGHAPLTDDVCAPKTGALESAARPLRDSALQICLHREPYLSAPVEERDTDYAGYRRATRPEKKRKDVREKEGSRVGPKAGARYTRRSEAS
jgi:hypothetical protein